MHKNQKSLSERLSELSPEQLKALLRKGKDESRARPGKPRKMEKNPEGIYRLSKAQERMWFLDHLSEGEGIYNNPAALKIQTVLPLHIDLLRRSLQLLIERHEILRTTFHLLNGIPIQKVHPEGKAEIIYEDLRGLSVEERELRAVAEAVDHGNSVIPLDTLPLMRFKVLHLDALEYLLLINPHHIISDGWSNALFAKELSMTYASLEGSGHPTSDGPEYQYVDYMQWEADWMKTPSYDEQLEFWKRQLSDLPESLHLPLDFQRPAVMSHRGGKETDRLEVDDSDQLRFFCKAENITLFHLLFGAFSLLMSNYSGQKDLIIGIPVARRNQLWFQQTMGLFINTLPMRIKTDGDQSASGFLKWIKSYCMEALVRQELPFEKLIEEINPERNLSTNPVFQVHFVHQNIPSLYQVEGISVMPQSIDYSHAKFDINFWVEEANRELILSVTYPLDIFRPETIRKLLNNYKTLLRSLLNHPDWPCRALEFFPDSERATISGALTLVEPTESIQASSWLEEFKARVKESPDFFAIRDLHRRLTYRELDSYSDLVTAELMHRGIGRGDRVGLLLPRNFSLVVSILGIFKAGAAYVPMDSGMPESRKSFILEDAGISLLITSRELSIDSQECPVPVLVFPQNFDDNEMEAGSHLQASKETQGIGRTYQSPVVAQPGPGKLAYIIYTSGTSGTPKGVCVGFDSLMNCSRAIWKRMGLRAGDSFATISSIAADLGNTMIFSPLIYGGEVVIVPEQFTLDAYLLGEWFKTCRVDCLKIVPSHLMSLLQSSRAKNLLPEKLLVLAGEACRAGIVSQVREIAPDLRIINSYGPTEATITSLTWEIPLNQPQPESTYPVGLPLENTSVYILGPEKQLLPKNIPGEIVLSGRNIAIGYLNREELTNEKFAKNPFKAGERMYFTGDTGFINEAGVVVFQGRKDHQIKVRGYRVEAGEIESALMTFPSIKQAAVIIPGKTGLVSLLKAAILIENGNAYDEQNLRTWLSQRLPAYMIPTEIHVLDSFPLTSNGKPDLREINKMVDSSTLRIKTHQPPRDLAELRLLNIFKDILGKDDVGIEDGFFDMGGHSLLAIQLFAAIEKEFHVHLPLATLFESENVKNIARLLRQSSLSVKPTSSVLIRRGNGNKHIFLVHPAGGNVLCYYDLARELGGEYSVWGIQSIANYSQNANDIDELARLYLADLLLPAEKGDVIFAGWSMGALIAFEMARQVGVSSGNLPGLMIIDQTAPFATYDRPEKENPTPFDRLVAFAGKVELLIGRSLDISPEILKGKTPLEQSEYFLTAFKSVNLVPVDMKIEDFHGYLELMIHHNEITSATPTGKFSGPTLLIRAEEEMPGFEGLASTQARTADLGWSPWTETLTIEKIPGNHISIMTQPFVKRMALAFTNWIYSGKG